MSPVISVVCGMVYTMFSLKTFKGGHLTYIFTTKIYTGQLNQHSKLLQAENIITLLQ